MKNFKDLFAKKTKDQVRFKFEEEMEKGIKKATLTEPDHYDHHVAFSKSPRAMEEDQPVVKMLNPSSLQQHQQTIINSQGQTISRDNKIIEGAFKRLLASKAEAFNYEERLNQAERLQKQYKYTLYDTESSLEDRSMLENKMIIEAVEQLEHLKDLKKELDDRKMEQREQIKQNIISRSSIPYTQENYQIVQEEANFYKEQVDDLLSRNDQLEQRNFYLEANHKELTDELQHFKNENYYLSEDLKKYLNQSRALELKLVTVIRENEELQNMRNHESNKLMMDNSHLKASVETLQDQIQNLFKANKELENNNSMLIQQIQNINMRDQDKYRSEKDEHEARFLQKRKESNTLMVIVKEGTIMRCVSEYMTFREYNDLGSLNRKYYDLLRNSMSTKCCIHYIKRRYVDHQPLYTVTYKSSFNKGGGGPISARFTNANTFPEMTFDHDSSFQSKKSDNNNHSLHSSSMISQSLEIFLPNVSQGDLSKYNSNDRVKQAIQRYVNEDQKVAVHSEMAMKRATQFLLSYATAVYSEEELNNMKKMFSSEDSYDVSLDEKNQSNELSQIVKQSFKQGLGSFINIFQSNNNQVEKPKQHLEILKKGGSNKKNGSGIQSDTSQTSANESQLQTYPLELQIKNGFLLQFQSSDDIHKYIVRVCTALVVQKDKITTIFRNLQQSYAELFFCNRLLYKECKDLELLKDFFKVRVADLKQKITMAQKEREEFEKNSKLEREQKEYYIKKTGQLEKRWIEGQQEMESHQRKSVEYQTQIQNQQRKIFKIEGEKQQMVSQMENEILKLRQQFEKAANERDNMKWAISEYHKYLSGTILKQCND